MRPVGRAAGTIRATWAVLALAAPVASGQAPAEDRVPAAPMVEAFLEHLTSAAGLQARFTQVNHWAVIDEADSARGVLTVVPPQRFRLEYSVPRGHLVGCDGQYVWTFVPEEQQALRADMSATTGWGDFFLQAFYEGADSLVTVTVRADGRRAARIALGPRPEWGVLSMDVALDADRGVPLSYAYTDEEGNRYQFDFETVQFPAVLPDTLFHFAVPSGYELVDVD